MDLFENLGKALRWLRDCQGNASAASQRLGIDRRTLQRKLQKLPPQK